MNRTHKAKLNIFFSLIQQGIAFVCGLIVPKLMLNAFGSEAYGATSSIAAFLSYIVLLEGGIGAVTRSALYKAFSNKSSEQVSAIITETKGFYRKVAFIFLVYVMIVAFFFKQISHNTAFGYWYSFGLVIVIAVSTFAEYFVGISYSLLLDADQMSYIVVIFRIVTMVLNTIGIIVLTSLKCDILSVKLLSSLVYAIRPLLLSIYVRRRYKLTTVHMTEKLLLNKKSAIGQHIAWTLHNNTDITVLTLMKDLTYVAVYSVYHMIVVQLQNILSSFSSGMEAVFGSMYANKETENLKRTFGYYETLISFLSVTMFSIAAVLIVPFINIYTSGLTDADYIEPRFAIALVVASLLYNLRDPYAKLIIAAGRYKETRIAAYGEAVINVLLSLILVVKHGLLGVAIGTVLANIYRFVYFAVYLSNHIVHRSIFLWIKRMLINSISFIVVFFLGKHIILMLSIKNYFEWVAAGTIVSLVAVLSVALIFYFTYRNDIVGILKQAFRKCNLSNSKSGTR